MARRSTMLAPDYPPMRTIDEFDHGLGAILRAEGIGRSHLVCQSYGGMLGQCYLARHPGDVDRLVLSSTGPADYRLPWLPVAYLIIALLRVLPERRVKAMQEGEGEGHARRRRRRRRIRIRRATKSCWGGLWKSSAWGRPVISPACSLRVST